MMIIEEMKAVDIRTVERNILVYISNVKIDRSLPPKECVRSFVGSLRIHITLAGLFVFHKIKLNFCTQKRVDCKDRYILQMKSSKLKIY